MLNSIILDQLTDLGIHNDPNGTGDVIAESALDAKQLIAKDRRRPGADPVGTAPPLSLAPVCSADRPTWSGSVRMTMNVDPMAISPYDELLGVKFLLRSEENPDTGMIVIVLGYEAVLESIMQMDQPVTLQGTLSFCELSRKSQVLMAELKLDASEPEFEVLFYSTYREERSPTWVRRTQLPGNSVLEVVRLPDKADYALNSSDDVTSVAELVSA